MIEVRDLTKDYGPHRAIDKLSFRVNKGEVVGFLGPNGAGKSTTMKIITGFMAPTEGSANVCGFDVFESPLEVKRRIGYLPEVPPLYAEMYVRDYLTFVARLKGVEKKNLKKQVDNAIEKTDLGRVHKRLIQNLSKGYQQRVGIAQALVSDPEVLIFDEPTVGLDPKQVAEIRKLINEIRGEHTVIISTHILSEVQVTCQRLIIINNGKIVVQDTLEGLSTMLQGGASLQLRVRRPSPEFAASLGKISGVQDVQASGANGNGFYQIRVDSGEEIIEQVAAHAVKQGVGLLELQPATMNLEDIFIKLTYDKEAQQ